MYRRAGVCANLESPYFQPLLKMDEVIPDEGSRGRVLKHAFQQLPRRVGLKADRRKEKQFRSVRQEHEIAPGFFPKDQHRVGVAILLEVLAAFAILRRSAF